MFFPGAGQVSRLLALLPGQAAQKPFNGEPSSLATTNTIPGGTPLRLCPESRDTDLFQISLATIERQPVYIDDVFVVHLDGEFLDTFPPNATFDITGNCGSYCDDYNVTDPRDREGETDTEDFCGFNPMEQPLGHHGNRACPPEEKGAAMITAMGWAMPMIVWWPGYYNFTFDAKTTDGRRIYCLTAEVCLRWEDDEKNGRYNGGPHGNCSWS
ncbi:hypothetical protein CC79DRAFT_1322485 [Sarocladium strictum]